MVRRPVVVLASALALSCAVFAKPDQPAAPPVVTSASSETPSVTIPLVAPPPAVTQPQPAPAEVATPTKVEPKSEPAKLDPAKVESAKVDPPKTEPVKTEAAKIDAPKVEEPKTETALAPTTEQTPPAEVKPAAKPKAAKPKPKLTKPPAEKSEDVAALESPPSSAKPPAFRCFVRDVMAFYDRTHVRCYNKARGQITFFAVDTSQPIASTVVTKSLNAMQMGKPVTITFAPGADLNPSNCDNKNCRRLLDIK